MQLLIVPLSLFVLLTAAIVAFGYFRLANTGQVVQRLNQASDSVDLNAAGAGNPRAAVIKILGRIGNLLPSSPQDLRILRKGLVAAGFRKPTSVAVFYGLKIVLGAGLFMLDLVLRDRFIVNPTYSLLSLFVAGAIGYFLPGFVLDKIIDKRCLALRLALPDMLDLLAVSTEAGSALDQAILYVCQELKSVHPALSEELAIVNFEMLAGKSRAEAFRDLGDRNREKELKKLMAVLIQTDRFGTSVAQALRSQSEFLRVRRRQMAQEHAGKLGVKIIFPIFFFCFPALLILVAGPGMLALFKNLFPAMKGLH